MTGQDDLLIGVRNALAESPALAGGRVYESIELEEVPEEDASALVVDLLDSFPLEDRTVGQAAQWRTSIRVRCMVRDNRRPAPGSTQPVHDLMAQAHGRLYARFYTAPANGIVGADPPRIEFGSENRVTRIGTADLIYSVVHFTAPDTLEPV